jgi:hypothetical protein
MGVVFEDAGRESETVSIDGNYRITFSRCIVRVLIKVRSLKCSRITRTSAAEDDRTAETLLDSHVEGSDVTTVPEIQGSAVTITVVVAMREETAARNIDIFEILSGALREGDRAVGKGISNARGRETRNNGGITKNQRSTARALVHVSKLTAFQSIAGRAAATL